MSVYVDTSAFLALANAGDERHEAAVRTWVDLVDRREQMVTSNYTVVETVSLLQSRHGIPAVRHFAEELLAVVKIEWMDADVHDSALSAILASSSKGSPSLVDCVGFEIIHRNKISGVFAYDRHFKNRGFNLVGS